jgi:hypothetical protein
MSETQSELTAVPGKPGWLRSPVIDDHEKLGEAREITVHAHDLRKHHVFTGPMPEDDAEAPPDGRMRSGRSLPSISPIGCLQSNSVK